MSNVSKSLLKGMEEALEFSKGNKEKAKLHEVSVPVYIDVRAIRLHLKLSRIIFAERFGFNLRTVEKWEQGVRQPEKAVRAYLTVIARNPSAVERALQ